MTAQAMMRPKFRRPREFNSLGRWARREVDKFVTTRLVMGLIDMQKSILETPVYTGRTLVNFRWSVGGPITSTRGAVAEPALPGKTSDLTLGKEPRRAANTLVVEEEFQGVLSSVRENPYQQIFLMNNRPNFSDVEFGTYARAGHRSRTPPGGMTRRGETLLEYDLMGIGKRVQGN
jgi:hypothetical protein